MTFEQTTLMTGVGHYLLVSFNCVLAFFLPNTTLQGILVADKRL